MISMNAARLPTPQVLILAAGFSSRLRRPKALVRVRALSLLRRTLILASRCTDAKIIVVVPPRAARYKIEARGLKAAFAANRGRAAGLSSSVRRGIELARYAPALLLLPVDMAVLRDRDVARLIQRWRGARRCVIARRIGRHGGIPLILPRWLYTRALAVTGDVGLRDLISGLPQPQRVLVEVPSAAFDVDTPQDLEAARRSLRRAAITA
jgi:molybdenum cofactor cytidylyltransferase